MPAKKRGRYYLHRVQVRGPEGKNAIAAAMQDPKPISRYRNDWALLDYSTGLTALGSEYHAAWLVKYRPESELPVVDLPSKSTASQPEENIILARSPVVWLPAYAGVAALRISGQIGDGTFRNRFAALVKARQDGFFIDCTLEAISDVQSFTERVVGLDSIQRISGEVRPPNPTFGPLWKPLRDYLRRRRVEKLKHAERAADGQTLVTNLQEVMRKAAAGEEPPSETPMDTGDVVVLMAIDGFGKGEVEGHTGGTRRVLKTSETQAFFMFPKKPEADALASEAERQFQSIQDGRGLRHDDE